ncbi:MAG: hypothetical protein LBO09_09315 [Candidatus Peribacteria bacterium]|nr:hypothetical protein [Candidatus Peribacteria bacterium]
MPDREMGRGIKAMVENNQLEDHTINLLVIVFKRAVDRLTDVMQKHKVMTAIAELEAQKEVQKQQDEADLQRLDGMLNAF